ncbi:MAG: fumarate hydratase C-terminal domain-containing protein [Lachnospiraceae bacterium]|nr:fumarate hydratase C-terminal domain-containing protein [Lachnospiraceae bacterium]
MDYKINLPFTEEDIIKIKGGDVLYLNGTVYSARDAAHKRMYDAINEYLEKTGKKPSEITSAELFENGVTPIDLKGTVLYYLGPTPAKPGQVIGSAGPTTSSRMDKYTPLLLDLGLTGMIGKGRRSDDVKAAIKRNKAVYMGATGGAGALLSKCIKSSTVIAYDDLGTEAIRKMEVENFPVTVLIDSEGGAFRV